MEALDRAKAQGLFEDDIEEKKVRGRRNLCVLSFVVWQDGGWPKLFCVMPCVSGLKTVPSQGEKEDTPLISAARNANFEDAKFLLEAKASVSAQNKVGHGVCWEALGRRLHACWVEDAGVVSTNHLMVVLTF